MHGTPTQISADLRVLQQALRMGIVMGIEVDSDNAFFPQILENRFSTISYIGQMTCFSLGKHGFSGQKIYFSFPIPSFILRAMMMTRERSFSHIHYISPFSVLWVRHCMFYFSEIPWAKEKSKFTEREQSYRCLRHLSNTSVSSKCMESIHKSKLC